MKSNYIICVDASCDLPQEFIKANDIYIIPMTCTLNDNDIIWKCDDEKTNREIYESQRHGDLTKTTLINPFNYIEYFKPLLEEGNNILYISLSSGLSSTYQSAVTAMSQLREEYKEQTIEVFDSLSATGGIGMLAERAVANREAGLSIEENIEKLTVDRGNLVATFMVKDLDYLKRGGRVSAATAFVGNLLSIVPLLEIDQEGKLATIAKARGNKKAIAYILDRFENNYGGGKVFVIDSDEPTLSTFLIEKIKEKHPDIEIDHTLLSPIIGAHTGPGMVGFLFFKK